EAWRLNAERRQRDPGAAASSAFVFCHRQYAAADPCAAPILWQKEPSDIDQPKFGSPVESADDFAGLRMAEQHGERAKVIVSGLAQIIGAQTIANHRCVSGIQLIGDGNVWVCPEIVIQQICLPSHWRGGRA